MTKKQENMLDSYRRMKSEYLYQVYKSCSAAKMEAYDACRKLQHEMQGYAGRVEKCGSFFFTYAFKYMENGKEYLCYMTGRNTYKFCIE